MTPLLLFAAACAASVVIAVVFPAAIPGQPIYAIWPATGLLLAALLHIDRAGWLKWLAAGGGAILATSLLSGVAPAAATGITATTIAEAAAAAAVLRALIRERFSLSRSTHIWALMLVAVLVPMLAGLAAGGIIAITSDTSLLHAWRGRWLADTTGVLLFTPLALAVMIGPTAFVRTGTRRQLIEAAIIVALEAVVATLIFDGTTPSVIRVPAYVLPLLLWSAFRLEPGGAATTLLGVCMIALWNTAQGEGPFSQATAPLGEWILRAQGAMATTCVSFLLLSSVVAERNQSARERAALLEQLQRAFAEIKTLQGLIPICAWCQKVRDDAGFWQEIEAYVHTHTQATFSHGICPDCNREMQSEIHDATLRNEAR